MLTLKRWLRRWFWRFVSFNTPLPNYMGFVRYRCLHLRDDDDGGIYALMPLNVLWRVLIMVKWWIKMPRWFLHEKDRAIMLETKRNWAGLQKPESKGAADE